MTTWKKRVENPVVLAAVVASLTTLFIGLITAGLATLTAYFQSNAEIEKARLQDQSAQRQAKNSLIVSAFAGQSSADRLVAYIASGVIDNSDCKLRKVLLHYNESCRPTADSRPLSNSAPQ